MASVSAKRSEERVRAKLPVQLGHGAGITRDVSATGVFFETDVNYAPGGDISFVLELDAPAGKLMLKCQGRIVRVENYDGKVGVAVEIVDSQLGSMTGRSKQQV